MLEIAIKNRLRNVDQYLFPTLCNALHSKKSKYLIYSIVTIGDVSFCMRLCRQIIKKMRETEIVNKPERLKEIPFEVLLWISSNHFERKVVNNIYKPSVTLLGSFFPNAIDYDIFKNLPWSMILVSRKNIWEWKILKDYIYIYIYIYIYKTMRETKIMKMPERLKRFPSRYCCVFQVIIFKE